MDGLRQSPNDETFTNHEHSMLQNILGNCSIEKSANFEAIICVDLFWYITTQSSVHIAYKL